MSPARIFHRVLGLVGGLELGRDAESDIFACLVADRVGPTQLAWGAGRDAGLSDRQVMERGAGSFLLYAAFNLADDLADGDCGYLDPPHRLGPGVQLLLQSLALRTLLAAGISPPTLAAVAEDVARAAAAQQTELRTRVWHFERARDVARGIAGRQFSANLRIFWDGTPLAPAAAEIGFNLGNAVHVAADIRSRDPRFTTLCPDDRGRLLHWARDCADRARAQHVDCIDRTLATFAPELSITA